MPFKNESEQKKAQSAWYERNKKAIIEKQKKVRAERRLQFRALKSGLKCSRCPESHPAALDFHHRDPSSKTLRLAKVVNRRWSLEQIQAEIQKCDVLCANCHRKEHYQEHSL